MRLRGASVRPDGWGGAQAGDVVEAVKDNQQRPLEAACIQL